MMHIEVLHNLATFGLLIIFPIQLVKTANINVYDSVPGLDPSPYYDIRIREKSHDHWIKTFPMITECTDAKNCGFGGIANHLKNWSNTYVNFEMKILERTENIFGKFL